METLWFTLLAFMLALYVLLDGFDLGAGAIHFSSSTVTGEPVSSRRTLILAASN